MDFDMKLDNKDLRCFCGSLISRVSKRGIELKCRRCKRVHIIPLSEAILESGFYKVKGTAKKNDG